MSGDTAGLILSWGVIIYFIFKFFSERSSLGDIDVPKKDAKRDRELMQSAEIQAMKKKLEDKEYLAQLPAKSKKKLFEKFDILDSTEDTWMQNLWRWADENDIGSGTIPRQKDKLMEVTVLQLFDSQLKTIPKEIGNLINLRGLRLKSNELTELPREIGNLTNLESLSLGGNKLTELPKEMNNLAKLRELWIAGNNFSKIPEVIWSLNNLTGLSLSDNNFTELPREIGSLTKLGILLLNRSNFVKIPVEIGKLVHLRRLEISRTDSLTKLPKEIGDLSSLEYLVLYENGIRELPKEIGNLSNLKALYCSFDKLIEVPKEIGKLESLIDLNLGFTSNSFTKIPNEIGRLKNLKILNISYLTGSFSNNDEYNEYYENIITQLPKEIVNLTNLISLELPSGLGTEYNEHINELLEAIKEKKKTLVANNSCYLETVDRYLNLSIKDIYTEKGTFSEKCVLKIIAQNFHREIEKIEQKIADGNVHPDTFSGFKIRAAVDDKTMIMVRVMADGWRGLIHNAYGQYRQESPPTVFKYINEVPYFDDLLSSSEPFWNGLPFAEVVLLHFKKIMKELTKDAVLTVSSESKMESWYWTEFEEYKKDPYVTHLEKLLPAKKRREEEHYKSDLSASANSQKKENIAVGKKIYLEVTLTPDKYLDHSGLAARKKLFNSKTVQSLNIHHDSGNIYDSKAIKVFYGNIDIGFIIKQGTNGKVDDFCFVNNSFLEDVELTWENGKLVLTKTEEGQELASNDDITTIGDLMWEKESIKMYGVFTMEYVKNLRLGGYDDWRLPTVDELAEVVTLCGGVITEYRGDDDDWTKTRDKNRANEVYQANYKTKGFMSYGYWSSATNAGDSGPAFSVNFYDGNQNYYATKSDSNYVRCVRDSQ